MENRETSPALPTVTAAARHLLQGEPIVFPTETVYGLGANAWDAIACARIYQIKRRPSFNPLIVHLLGPEWLPAVVANVPDWARSLAARFWPGPLTLVLPKTARVPDIVTAGLPTVAVRVPAHPLARALLSQTRVPIAAPSANRFTRLSPTRVEHAKEQLGDEVSIFLDGGPCAIGLESTIIGWSDGRPRLLRPGGLSSAEIESVAGPLEKPGTDAPVQAPGMLRKHYAPQTPLWIEGTEPKAGSSRMGLIAMRITAQDRGRYASCEELSAGGDLKEAATNLFAALRRLERAELAGIVARPVPPDSLGLAINDRLWRAAQS